MHRMGPPPVRPVPHKGKAKPEHWDGAMERLRETLKQTRKPRKTK
jgi:hypothetical protein